jgi:hypothetical protein
VIKRRSGADCGPLLVGDGEWARLAAASQSIQGVRKVSGSRIIGRCSFWSSIICRLAVRRQVVVGVGVGVVWAVGQRDLLASEGGSTYFPNINCPQKVGL